MSLRPEQRVGRGGCPPTTGPAGGTVGAPPRIDQVRVLLTNDDGISAPGLQAARRALRELDGVEVEVIAPDSNRSATARSITTRSPLTVEEVEFGDGDRGFATDGTPVDCVRFAELGLVGERPDLIVSGINHGANLGDDITYSGTVAAAFEGIVLGHPGDRDLPAVLGRRHGLRQRPLRLRRRRRLPRSAGRQAGRRADAAGDAGQRQLPGRGADRDRGDAARQTRLQRRAEAGRRGRRRAGVAATRSTASQPCFEETEGTDLSRSPRGGSR